jgi:hypothetical protein
MDTNKILDLFIRNFILKERRERSEFELKNDKKRNGFTNRLNHKWTDVLDMRFISKIPSVANDYEFVAKELKIKDIELCYLISN